MQIPGAQKYETQIAGLQALANIVEVDEKTFRTILRAHERPTIVRGPSGALWFKRYNYLTSYDGFVFCLRAPGSVDFEADAPGAFLVEAKKVTIPFL